jgi:predicted transglutaminase-like cysteine proteinase
VDGARVGYTGFVLSSCRRFLPLCLLLPALAVWLGWSHASGWDAARLKAAARQYYGASTEASVDQLLRWQDSQQGLADTDKLARVNQWWNLRLRFDTDQNIWKQADYWATPLESLATGAGDCEDFSIAKYVSLLALGIPEAKLRLVYVKARTGGVSQAHMVLAYYATPEAEPLILDNLQGAVVPASQRPDLAPIFSFNAAGVWVGGSTRAQSGAERLSRWRELLARLQSVGF